MFLARQNVHDNEMDKARKRWFPNTWAEIGKQKIQCSKPHKKEEKKDNKDTSVFVQRLPRSGEFKKRCRLPGRVRGRIIFSLLLEILVVIVNTRTSISLNAIRFHMSSVYS